MLDDGQLAALEQRGHVLLAGFVDPEGVAAMQDAVWSFLHGRGIEPDRPADWPPKIDKLQPLRKAGAFDPFLRPELDRLADQLIGAGQWSDLGTRPQALVSLPEPGPWTLPHQTWHFDLPPRGPTATWGAVRFLGFVDRVAPRGGGTLVVEGSHRLVRRLVEASPDADAGHGADARKVLRRHPWFAALNDSTASPEHLLEGAEVDGVDVRVVELTGDAGDLVVMHPWLMHNIAMNCSERPRMMMSYTRYGKYASMSDR
ncbi:MAG: phytanoyl-CoA dioxygenase family protein [Acidimicrobiales bacterium]|nr:phytanoyl-CoA dioxygenase family protein [Acidimicrobiales bacterium]